MDRLEAKEFLQAASLGCLNKKEFDELRELLEFDSELQFELAAYQTLCAMIPFSLEIINPGEIVKDNVALRLKKIEEELRAKKEAELKSQLSEIKIEDTSEINEEIQKAETSTEDLTQELSDETVVQEIETEVEIETPEVFEAPIPESYLAEDLTATEDIPDIAIEEEIISEEFIEKEIVEIPNEQIQNEFTTAETTDFASEEISSEIQNEKIEDIKYEQPKQAETKSVVESYDGQVKVEHKNDGDPKFSDITSRSIAEKLQKSFQMDIESIKNSIEKTESKYFKGIISLIILTAILLAVIIFLFFKFTADIKKLEMEIEGLKKSNSVGSIFKNDFDHSSLL